MKMKMLQTFAAETISNCLSKKDDINFLRVPKPLLTDLNNEYDKIWRVAGKSISISKLLSSSAPIKYQGLEINFCSDSCRLNFAFGSCFC